MFQYSVYKWIYFLTLIVVIPNFISLLKLNESILTNIMDLHIEFGILGPSRGKEPTNIC